MSSPIKARMALQKPNSALLVGATAISMGLLLGGQYTFPVLSLPMANEFEWGRGAVTATFSIRLLVGVIGQLLLGGFVDRYGPRRMGIFGAGLFAAGLGLSSNTQSLWHLYVSFGGLVAIGATFLELSILTVLTKHFNTRRGLAIGITWAGGGAGIFILLTLIQALVSNAGWRVGYFYLSLSAICLIPLILLFFPLASNDPLGKEDDPRGINRRQAIGTSAFWLLFLGNTFIGVFDEAVSQHFIPFAIQAGYAEMVAASALGLVSLLYILGQMIGGMLSDRYGREGVVITASILTILSLLFLITLTPSRVPYLWMIMGLYGLGLGANLAARAASWGDVFQGGHFASIIGIIWSGYAIGGAFIAWFGGWAYDFGGSYVSTFIVAIAGTILWCLTLLRVAPRRYRARITSVGQVPS